MKSLFLSMIITVMLFSNLMILSAQKADIPEPKILWEIKGNMKNIVGGSYEQNQDDSNFIMNEFILSGLKLKEVNDIIVDSK
ncbi:MAG TPA: hypothetical protein PK771_07190, partial [Spirochaetota bacterium]|nr:hypothetical protein [Spirochaetota bacterium]